MIFLIYWFLGIIVGIVTTIMNNSMRDIVSISTNLLFYQLTLTLSFSGISGFIGHVFVSDKLAESIGWQKGNPFQKELGFSQAGYIVTGFLCIWYKGYFWLPTILIFSIFNIGCLYIHIKETFSKKNYKLNNTITMIPNILIPVTLIILSITSGLWK